MTAILQTQGLSKRYRQRWALADCTLTIPAGHVIGLVGPNGAGKTTLLHLATGLLAPTTGTIEVLGSPPASSPAQLARIGFVAQDAPQRSDEAHRRPEYDLVLTTSWRPPTVHRPATSASLP